MELPKHCTEQAEQFWIWILKESRFFHSKTSKILTWQNKNLAMLLANHKMSNWNHQMISDTSAHAKCCVPCLCNKFCYTLHVLLSVTMPCNFSFCPLPFKAYHFQDKKFIFLVLKVIKEIEKRKIKKEWKNRERKKEDLPLQ